MLRSPHRSEHTQGAVFGLLAATLFGLGAPLSKLLLPSMAPLSLASLLYLGGGVGLVVFGLARRLSGVSMAVEARLTRRELPLLAAVIVTGGIVGPVLMLTGLERLSASATSLLLNLEAPFTVIIAVLAFGEHLGRRAVFAAALIFAGAGLLGMGTDAMRGDWLGVLCVAGACASWALDNNLTQRLTLKDPVAVVRWKALGAGGCMLVVAGSAGLPLPGPAYAGAALVIGAAAYGASILLDMYALRLLGAAREAAYFATAPFIGAVASVPLLGEIPSVRDGVSAVLMVAGVVLLARDRHTHVHTHAPMEHEHLHVHDEHHPHTHGESEPEPHSHPHRHEPMTHDHPHVSDLHHRHRH